MQCLIHICIKYLRDISQMLHLKTDYSSLMSITVYVYILQKTMDIWTSIWRNTVLKERRRKNIDDRWSSSSNTLGAQSTAIKSLETSICLYIGKCEGVVTNENWEVGKDHLFTQWICIQHLLTKGFLILARKFEFMQIGLSNFQRTWKTHDSICILESSFRKLGSELLRGWQDKRQLEIM